MQIPLLFLGDSPSTISGLGRIGRDLARIASGMPEFRVGFLGRGSTSTIKLGFMQYPYPEWQGWGQDYIQYAWGDFSRGTEGVIMTIWDPSRLLWFSHPVGLPDDLRNWLEKPPFKKWGYFAIDHSGPLGALSPLEATTIVTYDRALAYTEWGADVIRQSGRTVEWLPHGYIHEDFQPREQGITRQIMNMAPGDKLVGCVMTNQARKDWGLAYAVLRLLKDKVKNLRAWLKVDTITRAWDLKALTADFGLSDTVYIDTSVCADHDLSYYYSACDLTILPTSGEGFGYPVVESLACGVPVVTGSYGGAAELIPKQEWLVEPLAWRVDGPYDCLRPVYDPQTFAAACLPLLGGVPPEECVAAVEHLRWENLKPRWERWFREGLSTK